MAIRMLCMQCYELAEPDTVLEGSERLELAAWCCFLIPGLLYCAWRHLSRAKACPRCGSHVLMRESRAAAARRPRWTAPEPPPRLLDGGDFRWPRPLASPRRRLRVGGLGALLVAIACGAWLAAVADPTPARHAVDLATLCWLAVTVWLARQYQRLAKSREDEGCAAWDDQGRPLHIERV